ncbi:MAG TPA: glycosyltransferase [Candidatus Acidoferrum sp.]|nr:glycosyltransferase [Candidatus Acidoferrum sp.]
MSTVAIPVKAAPSPALQPLRVMHVLNYVRRGGTEFGILKLMDGHDKKQFEHLLCTTRQYDQDFVDAYALRDRLYIAAGKNQGLQFPFLRLKKIFEACRPHIVHTRNWGALEAVPAARLAGVPVIIHSEHGYETHNMDGLPIRQRVFRRFAYSMVDTVFTVTRELRDYHARQAWLSPERISVIPNGVDSQRFSPSASARCQIRAELGISPDTLVLGTVGRMVPIKDYGTLLASADALAQRGLDVHVLLVGKGPELPALQARAASLPSLARKVSFLGASDRVHDLLNAMDIFVLTSLSEGMSNTLLEAMSTGLPVLATRAGGNPEVIGDANSRWLFSPRDVRGLADLVERLAHDAAARALHGEKARNHILEEFSLERMWQRYSDLYTQAVARRRPAASSLRIHSSRQSPA